MTTPIALEYYSDHMLVRMVGPAALSSLKRTVVVPYSDIADVEVRTPEWPATFANRIGTHIPRVAVSGTFMSWRFTERQFLHFDRKTARVLTMKLSGHPDFVALHLEVRDPDAAAKEIRRRTEMKQ